MENSLQELLGKFPYFLEKKSSGNFYKSESVFNAQFRELYQNLFETYLAGKVVKRVWCWKEQSEPSVYTIHFYACLPKMKRVTLLENSEAIYTQTYENDNNEHIFEYSYEGSSESIIPQDKYNIIVETYDEYVINKGFPENDEVLDDEYDHDLSLDEFGAFINLPRKEYSMTDDVAGTEPPYNDRLTEDDYHYMNRILFYLDHLDDIPLPVLEIWKLFGIPVEEIQLTNREQILCKMYSESLHPNINWIPEHGEHKDLMCIDSVLDDLFFTVTVDNNTPLQGQDCTFKFHIMDSLGREVSNVFYIVPYFNDVAGDPVTSDEVYITPAESGDYYFKCYLTRDEAVADVDGLQSNSIHLSVRGCTDADWYVNPEGDDSNNGTSTETPFKTLAKAVSMVEGSKNIIVLSDGEHTVEDTIPIVHDTKIISCQDDNPILISDDEKVFEINQDTTLYVRNVGLSYSLYSCLVDDATFVNRNLNREGLYVVVDVMEILANTGTPLNLLFGDDYIDTAVLNDHEWSTEITDGDSDATFVVDDDSSNPNVIFTEEEDE